MGKNGLYLNFWTDIDYQRFQLFKLELMYSKNTHLTQNLESEFCNAYRQSDQLLPTT